MAFCSLCRLPPLRRFFVVLGVAAAVLSLPGCGSSSATDGASANNRTTVTRPPTTRPPTTATPTTASPTTTVPTTMATVPGVTVPPPPPDTLPYRCDPNYTGDCVPIASDVDCAGGRGNGPEYVGGPVRVVGADVYGLDRDGDGIGCE